MIFCLEYISLNEFKEIGNKTLDKITIVISNKPREIENVNERLKLIKQFHNDPVVGGHVGKKRLLAKLQMYCYWRKMYIDVSKYVDNCQFCKVNKSKNKNVEPLQITVTPEKPFDIVVIDTIGPFNKTNNDKKYAVTIICNLSKYLIIVPIPNKESETVARAIFNNVVLVYGPMKSVLTHNGT